MKTITIFLNNEGWQNISRKDFDDNLLVYATVGCYSNK